MEVFKYLVLVPLLFYSFTFCNDQSKQQEFNSLLDSATVELSDIEVCAIRAYYERGLEGDKCMVDCILNGKGKNVGGGCPHICFAYGRFEFEELPELTKCFTDTEISN
ncbi:MAG: hypothetical protein ED557_06840 [Balneola sp.]|nr:MAG: hypothetical protein ED557_06840 [Balneola sp.]